MKRFFLYLFLIGCLLASAPRAQAVLPVFNIDAFYFSDTFLYNSATTTVGRTFASAMIGLPLIHSGRIVLGWNYDTYSFSDNPGTAQVLALTGMGPEILFYLNKDRTWVGSLVYDLICTGTYTSGSTSTKLNGKATRASFGYTVPMTEWLLMGAKMNYYVPSLTEEITNNTTIANVSNSRTVLYPTFTMTIRFE